MAASIIKTIENTNILDKTDPSCEPIVARRILIYGY